MPVRLVYTGSDTRSGTVSPFDKEIQRISRGKALSIACPYISTRYLDYLVRRAKSWRLVTDCEEWLGSLSPKARSAACAFITKHRRRIHHYPRLHAKVILTDRSALMGSANLTEQGLTRRVEMAVLIEDEPDIGEVHKWFDGLWKQSGEAKGDELERLMRFLPKKEPHLTRRWAGELFAEAPTFRLAFVDPLVAAGIVLEPSPSESNRRLLARRLRLFGNREQAEAFLDLAQELLDYLDLEGDDPRLVTSLPSADRLAVTVNYRYVLAAMFDDHDLAFIFEASARSRRTVATRARAPRGRFDRLSREGRSGPPYFFRFPITGPTPIQSLLSAREKLDWKTSARAEIGRAKASRHRAYHRPVFFRAIVDLSFRRRILDQAYER